MTTIGVIKSYKGHKGIWLACPNCGKERLVPLLHGKQKYELCVKCAHPRGNKNPKWKGGRLKQQSGYIIVHTPGHPRATKHGYVREHVLIWEQAHNKTLPQGWVIHHLNGIKDDNRPRNLIALPKGEHHFAMHMEALKQRIRELEAENKLLEKALDESQMIFKISEN